MRSSLILLFLALFIIAPAMNAMADTWWPIQVKSHYGTYDAALKESGKPSKSLSRPKLEEWSPPHSSDRTYTLGVSFPHLKDTYWVAVNYGIIEEARRLGMGIRLMDAGGYGELSKQQEQVRELAKQKVDGIILGSISYEGNDALIADLEAQGIPVVEAINDVNAPAVSAKAMVSYYEMGYYAGEFMAEHAEDANLHHVRVAFFPGPKKTGWAPDTMQGFLDATEFYPGTIEFVDVQWGDTGRDIQHELVSASVKKTGPVDYIVGNALAAEVAPAILEEHGLEKKTSVISTYIIPSLYDVIARGEVIAAPSDLTVFQGRMAVDMMVRVLNGETPGKDFPFRSGPFIPMVTPNNIARYPYEGLFGPRDYTPIFNMDKAK